MIWPGLFVLILDRLSKLAILKNLRVHETVTVIPGFFQIVHVRNRGMAFGMFNRLEADHLFYLMLAASLGAVILLSLWFFRLKEKDARLIFGLSLILGGAFGNLIDRILYQSVVDFLDFYLGHYHWPAFNVADAGITVGTFWVALNLLFKKA